MTRELRLLAAAMLFVACRPVAEPAPGSLLGDDAATYWPAAEWRQTRPALVGIDEDRKRMLTVRDLLTMRTGLDWSESVYEGSPLQQLNRSTTDWLRFVIDWPMRELPGTRWEYNSGGVILLGGAIGLRAGMNTACCAMDAGVLCRS